MFHIPPSGSLFPLSLMKQGGVTLQGAGKDFLGSNQVTSWLPFFRTNCDLSVCLIMPIVLRSILAVQPCELIIFSFPLYWNHEERLENSKSIS